MDTLFTVLAYILFTLGGSAIVFAAFTHEYNKENNALYDADGVTFFIKIGLGGVALCILGIWISSLRS